MRFMEQYIGNFNKKFMKIKKKKESEIVKSHTISSNICILIFFWLFCQTISSCFVDLKYQVINYQKINSD